MDVPTNVGDVVKVLAGNHPDDLANLPFGIMRRQMRDNAPSITLRLGAKWREPSLFCLAPQCYTSGAVSTDKFCLRAFQNALRQQAYENRQRFTSL
jgi:hypothetical protein